MRYLSILLLLLGIFSSPLTAQAQFGGKSETESSPNDNGIHFGKQKTQLWKVGIIVRAQGGPCAGLLGTVPVPSNWPEQQVKIVNEEITKQVRRVKYRTLANGVKQMLVQIPRLEAGETAKALITFEVTKAEILAPVDPSIFLFPSKPPREVKIYLGTSPFIESRSPKIRTLAKEVIGDKENAWEQVEAMYDWVRDNVEYKKGKLKGALAALRDGDGDCEELTSLFIAMCRSQKIPARTIWVPGHCYPEFYLQDKEGNGHWFPCQAAGTKAFGYMPDDRPILQKGDNFKVPEQKNRVRYVPELLKGKSFRGAGKPSVTFVRNIMPAKAKD